MKHYPASLESLLSDGRKLNISFEFFPPKTEEMEMRLWEAISQLQSFNPHFVSITYGAGGATRERTHQTIKKILDQTELKPAAHLTCIAASKDEIHEILKNYWEIGVRHIVALRGDMLASSSNYQLHSNGYKYANELVMGIKKIVAQGMNFEISVAGYPEKHPEAKTFDEDIDNLKCKVDAGANRIITQFFFDADVYFRFVEKCHKAGINVPIVPGILPVANMKQTQHFAKICGTKIPKWMSKIFEGLDERQEMRQLVAVIVANELCRILNNGGVNDFHFYTMNHSDLTAAICRVLGVRESNLLIASGLANE